MEPVQPYSTQWLSNVEVPLANKFYRAYGFRGKAKRHECCAVVRDEHNAIIACGYLRDHAKGYVRDYSSDHVAVNDGFKLLAGVAVAPAYQGKGVARLLLGQLSEAFDTHTYTFPYQYLQPFYLSLGFRLCDVESQASSVRDLYQGYQDQGRDIGMMVYLGSE